MGCDELHDYCRYLFDKFQSTHPSGVRPVSEEPAAKATVFQSTHPSGVRLRPLHGLLYGFEISIHAPQWGATRFTGFGISVNTPFQSTHPSGVRLVREQVLHVLQEISIHAPQWGATSDKLWTYLQNYKFQSTHPSGVRRGIEYEAQAKTEFQSTHPSGVRRCSAV